MIWCGATHGSKLRQCSTAHRTAWRQGKSKGRVPGNPPVLHTRLCSTSYCTTRHGVKEHMPATRGRAAQQYDCLAPSFKGPTCVAQGSLAIRAASCRLSARLRQVQRPMSPVSRDWKASSTCPSTFSTTPVDTLCICHASHALLCTW